jgi:hypothetical protein
LYGPNTKSTSNPEKLRKGVIALAIISNGSFLIT